MSKTMKTVLTITTGGLAFVGFVLYSALKVKQDVNKAYEYTKKNIDYIQPAFDLED